MNWEQHQQGYLQSQINGLTLINTNSSSSTNSNNNNNGNEGKSQKQNKFTCRYEIQI